PAGRARHGRGVPHRRPHHGDGQRRGHRLRRTAAHPRASAGGDGLPRRGARMNTVPLVEIDGLHAGYGDSRVLHGVSFAVPAGSALGLLGRNGMGKTTLIRTLMGYLRPSAGRVHWQGRDVTGWPPERIARLGAGYVPEGRGIFPNLSVRENLVMAARAAADGQQPWTLERVLETFPRLGERLAHGGQQLSGG